jgi:hypothetical protein
MITANELHDIAYSVKNCFPDEYLDQLENILIERAKKGYTSYRYSLSTFNENQISDLEETLNYHGYSVTEYDKQIVIDWD